jgi:Subtilase family
LFKLKRNPINRGHVFDTGLTVLGGKTMILNRDNDATAADDTSTPPELIVVMRPEFARYADSENFTQQSRELSDVLNEAGAHLRPLFKVDSKMRSETPHRSFSASDFDEMSHFHFVDAPDERLSSLVEKLNALSSVEYAYLKPGTTPAVFYTPLPLAKEPPATTPLFVQSQGYLDPAPSGIDAKHAWDLDGGNGSGVTIFDCETAWNFAHEDLLEQQFDVVVGASDPGKPTDHGTAVIGEMIGNRNNFGITGIVYAAKLSAAALPSTMFDPTAQTIKAAADSLNPGDVLVVERQRTGPQGMIAIEWWEDDLRAIRYAVNKDIVVVAAAGNGGQDLDAPIYDQPPPLHPGGRWRNWKNPFNPTNPSSGAVLVGAGNPPSGTHGRAKDPDRKEPYVDRARCGFSNFGRRVDCQGWGYEVTTAGYGDLQGGANRNRWFTDTFNGTSAATPIVAGAIAAVNGVLKALGHDPLNSFEAISLLRQTGSPQQDAPGRPKTQRIGNRPNLRQLIDAAGRMRSNA